MKKEKKQKTIIVCSMVICLFLIATCVPLLYIFLDSIGVIDDIIYGKYVPSKEEIFQLLKDNQDEFEILAGDVEGILLKSGEYALVLDGRREYAKNGLKSELLKKYPIKTISADNINEIMEVRFDFEIKSDSIIGIYYVSDGEPSIWGDDQGIEKNNGVYTKKGSYYIYETEKIIGNWYYYHVTMW